MAKDNEKTIEELKKMDKLALEFEDKFMYELAKANVIGAIDDSMHKKLFTTVVAALMNVHGAIWEYYGNAMNEELMNKLNE